MPTPALPHNLPCDAEDLEFLAQITKDHHAIALQLGDDLRASRAGLLHLRLRSEIAKTHGMAE